MTVINDNNSTEIYEVCKITKKSWIEIIVDSNDSKMKFRKMINFNE